MDLKYIKKLIDLVENSKISGLRVEEGEHKIEIKKELRNESPPIQVVQSLEPTKMDTLPSQEPQSVPQKEPTDAKKTDENLKAIPSPMIGTFYNSPNPDSSPYLQSGQKVKEGDTVCIIEAMKLFNEIESDISGTVEKICVETGTPVEYGQDLFLIRVD